MSNNNRLDGWKKQYDDNHYSNKNSLNKAENQNNKVVILDNSFDNKSQGYHVVVNSHMKFVGFWRRWFAYLIDSIILTIFIFLIHMEHHPLMVLIIWSLYTALLISSPLKATIGKLAIGAIVVDTYGRQITFIRATLRYFASLLSALLLCIGFIMIAFHAKKKSLHDQICRTIVINKE